MVCVCMCVCVCVRVVTCLRMLDVRVSSCHVREQDNNALSRGVQFCIDEVNRNGGLRVTNSEGESVGLMMSLNALNGSLSSITEELCISVEEAQSGIPAETLVEQQIIENSYVQLVENGTDALIGPFSSLYTFNASAAVNGTELFFATQAAAASLYNRSIESFYGVLPRTQILVGKSGIFQILASQNTNGGGSVRFGLTYESTDPFGTEACMAAYDEVLDSGGEVQNYESFSDTLAVGQSAFSSLENLVRRWISQDPIVDVFVLCGLPDLFPQIRGIFSTQRPKFKAGVFIGGLDQDELFDFTANVGWINTNLWLASMPLPLAPESVQYEGIEAFTTPKAYNRSFYKQYKYAPGEEEAVGTAACLLFVTAAEMAASIEKEDVDAAMATLDITNFWGRNKMEDGPIYKNNNIGKKTNGIQYTTTSATSGEPLFLQVSAPSEIQVRYQKHARTIRTHTETSSIHLDS